MAWQLSLCRCFPNYTLYLPEQRTHSHRPITFQHPYETTTYTHSIHEQCVIWIFFLRLLLRMYDLLKLLRMWFLNRSYPGTLFRCRESRPYHEELRLKTTFYPFLPALATLFCIVHQWSRWPCYRLWVFNILKFSCTDIRTKINVKKL